MQRHLPGRRSDWSAGRPSAEERGLLARFIDAHERCDAAAAVAIAAEDIRVTMPPLPVVFDGLDMVGGLLARAFGPERDGDWRLCRPRPTGCRRPRATCAGPGDTAFRAFKLDVLRVDAGAIAEITTFGYALFPAFGLPEVLPEG